MAGYEQYRMTDWGWVETYQHKMGIEQFRTYRDEVYALLLRMKPGESFDINAKVKVENIDLFIKIVCSFITEDNNNYDFTNDYKKVRCHAKGDLESCRHKISERKMGAANSEADSGSPREDGECSESLHSPETINSPRYG